MLEPGFYPHRPGSVELRTTNISWVFLAGDLAYKVKRPVVFPFLDYGTAARRRLMCHEEVRLNRRLAPAIYLRVVGIARRGGSGGFALVDEDDSGAVDYAVEMRRVDERHSFDALARRGRLGLSEVDPVAELLAHFHAGAEPASSPAESVEALAAALVENLQTLGEAANGVLGERELAAAAAFTDSFLSARRGELDQRAARGLVHDCHGDLRAEHVVVPPGDEPYIYDCVEFNRDLRLIDVAADLAFLVMDLVRLDADDQAERLVRVYRNAGGDPGDEALLSFLAAYRAWVRAKVAALGARDSPDRARLQDETRELFELGRRFAWRARSPMVLVLCGVSGSGKSTLARAIAERSGWPHLSSDAIRKGLAGIPATTRGGSEHYSPEFTERTYRDLGAATATTLADVGGTLVDATFHLRSERDAFRAGLGQTAAPVLFVQCRVPTELLVARAKAREGDPNRISDAGPEIVGRQLAELEPLEEVPDASRFEIATDRPVDELANAVEREVLSRLWS